MRTRRSFLQSGAGAFAAVALGDRPTHAADAPGITDTEIRIGQTMPYSGPSSDWRHRQDGGRVLQNGQ